MIQHISKENIHSVNEVQKKSGETKILVYSRDFGSRSIKVFQNEDSFGKHPISSKEILKFSSAALSEYNKSFQSYAKEAEETCNAKVCNKTSTHLQGQNHWPRPIKSTIHLSFRGSTYPRKCDKCYKTYQNRCSFHKHKKKCNKDCMLSNHALPQLQNLFDSNIETGENCIPQQSNKTQHFEKRNSIQSTKVICFTSNSKESGGNRIVQEYNATSQCFDKGHRIRPMKVIHSGCNKTKPSAYPITYGRCSKTYQCDRCRKTHQCETSFYDHVEKCKEACIARECETNSHNEVGQSIQATVYPKTCDKCFKTYHCETSFYFHNKMCNETSANLDGQNIQAVMGVHMQSAETKCSIYPRTCVKCSKTYKSKSSFFCHKKRCKETSDIVRHQFKSMDEFHVWLRNECNNTFSTFRRICGSKLCNAKIYSYYFCQLYRPEKTYTRKTHRRNWKGTIPQDINCPARIHVSECIDKVSVRYYPIHNHDLKYPKYDLVSEKPYKCDICDKCFSQKGAIEKHTLFHTGEKLHECDICQKRFSNSCNLNRHLLTHGNMKSYECEVCKKFFMRKGTLDKHLLTHIKMQPNECVT